MNGVQQYEELLETPAGKEVFALSLTPSWPELPHKLLADCFPLSTLPPIARDIVEAEAEALQVHPDMISCFLLGALSTCTVGKGSICVRPGYQEPLQLYIAVAANPSERKSPALAHVFRPIHEYETRMIDEGRPVIRDAATRIGMKKKQLDAAQKKGYESEALTLAKEIETLESIKPYELIIGAC